jgi:hypothetical protein
VASLPFLPGLLFLFLLLLGSWAFFSRFAAAASRPALRAAAVRPFS